MDKQIVPKGKGNPKECVSMNKKVWNVIEKMTRKELIEAINNLPLQPRWMYKGNKDELAGFLYTAHEAGYYNPASKEAGE